MKKTESNEQSLIISVIKKYYELGMTQEQIAKDEFISKSSVCRLIKRAEVLGYVEHRIHYPSEPLIALEDEFCRIFPIDKAYITPSYSGNEQMHLNDTCKSMILDLCKIVKQTDTIGVSWGITCEKIADLMSEMQRTKKCSKVTLIIGSVAGKISSSKSSGIVEQFAAFFSAQGYILPVPLIVDSKQVAQIIRNDSHINQVFDIALEASIVILSIGALGADSVLRTRGAFSDDELDAIIEKGAVGNVAGHCVDIKGNPVSTETADRMIGLTVEEITEKPIRIGVAVGKHKAAAIAGALNSGMINRFYCDEIAAKEVISIVKKNKIYPCS